MKVLGCLNRRSSHPPGRTSQRVSWETAVQWAVTAAGKGTGPWVEPPPPRQPGPRSGTQPTAARTPWQGTSVLLGPPRRSCKATKPPLKFQVLLPLPPSAVTADGPSRDLLTSQSTTALQAV